ncbi:DgyrCDS799 [Dimorphilus gyrociliatus]|uniref:Phospholipid scramblase n=1 Tax=Dimorphilus gyrociliatus TaxID=2664684 RepID=A0A7I8V5L3_9ANNE|nr:DgyrCDS799 [Dimorphilus gyrociliatus]
MSRGMNRTPTIISVQPKKEDDKLSLNDQNMKEFILPGLSELAFLQDVDLVRIEQQMPFDLKAGCGAGNTYNIYDRNHERILYAVEDANCFCRWTCGPHRMFHITVYLPDDTPVLHFDRSCCRCDWCCCFNCCLCQHSLEIRDTHGWILGRVRERFHIFNLKLTVEDPEEEIFMRVRGSCCACRCCTDMHFDIINDTGVKEVGYISKKYLAKEVKEGKRRINVSHEYCEMYIHEETSSKNIHTRLKSYFGDETLSEASIRRWAIKIKKARKNLEDLPRSGRPKTALTDQNKEAVDRLIREDQTTSQRAIAKNLDNGQEAVGKMIKELGYRKICGKWIPYNNLNQDQKEVRVSHCMELLDRHMAKKESFLKKIVIGDESEVYLHDPESKRASLTYKHTSSPPEKKLKMTKSVEKLMCTVFRDCSGLIHLEFMDYCETINPIA